MFSRLVATLAGMALVLFWILVIVMLIGVLTFVLIGLDGAIGVRAQPYPPTEEVSHMTYLPLVTRDERPHEIIDCTSTEKWIQEICDD